MIAKMYFDSQDPTSPGWAYRIGAESGALDGDEAQALEEFKKLLRAAGIEAELVRRDVDGGVWEAR